MKELLDKKVFLLDVEGVLCDNIDIQTCLPRVPEFISFLKDHDIGISIVTNISRKPRQVVFDKLKSMGIPVLIEEIFTSGSTTAMFIKNQYPDARCFVISEWGLKKDIEDAGITISDDDVDIVAIGANRNLTFNELNHAMRLVFDGSKLICSGTTKFFKGTFFSDTGYFLGESSIAQAISHATNKPVTYIGKPYPEIFQQILSRLNISSSEAVMIGDNIQSDIRGSNLLGIDSILTTNDIQYDYSLFSDSDKPKYVVKDINELCENLF